MEDDASVKKKRISICLHDNCFRMELSVNSREGYKIYTYMLMFARRNNGRINKNQTKNQLENGYLMGSRNRVKGIAIVK